MTKPLATNGADPLLRVSGLRVEVLTASGPRLVVKDLSFDVDRGEFLAVIGESGSGKSVATRALLGLLPCPPLLVTRGTALFEGADLLALTPARLDTVRGRRIGMVFQEPMSALNPTMSVGDQIADSLVVHLGLSWSAARREAVQLLERMRIPDAAGRARLSPAELSGGMRQRVVIAAAIACKPSLIIADEPTTALDPSVQGEILGLLRELRAEMGCSVLLITHDMAVVRQTASRVLVMKGGSCVEEGACAQILDAPQADYTRTLIEASRPAPLGPEPPPHSGGTDALAVRDLVVSYPAGRRGLGWRPAPRLFALDGVSLSVRRGETLALVGESGSGKTTLARAVLGLASVENGRIWLDGADLVEKPDVAKGAVQYIFQDPASALDPRWRVWRSATEPLKLTGAKDDLRAVAARIFADVGLSEAFLDRYPHELSGGQRQRVGIARALSVSPKLVIADEAVAALDATTRLQVLELLREVQRRTGLPMLFITHDMAAVSRLAHRVAVMRFGRIVEIGPTERILAAPVHAYTRILVDTTGERHGVMPTCGGHRVGAAGSARSHAAMRAAGLDHLVSEDDAL